MDISRKSDFLASDLNSLYIQFGIHNKCHGSIFKKGKKYDRPRPKFLLILKLIYELHPRWDRMIGGSLHSCRWIKYRSKLNFV